MSLTFPVGGTTISCLVSKLTILIFSICHSQTNKKAILFSISETESLKPGFRKERKRERKSSCVSYIIVITGSMQAWQRWKSKHKYETFFLLLPSALCSVFTATQVTEAQRQQKRRQKKKEIFRSFRLRFCRAHPYVSPFSR